MPTNEERREIAARLRDYKNPREHFMESTILAYIYNRLADLIEPEPERTCRFRNDGRGILWCDAEGCDYDMDDYFPIPNYCPNCGSKVVGE